MAAEQGLTVDEAGFRRLMDEQRARAKKDAAAEETGNGDISVYRSLLEQAGKVVVHRLRRGGSASRPCAG